MLHMIEHTFEDTWLMLPLLFLSYLVIEHFERKGSDDDKVFRSLQKYGPLVGAFIGVIPQCGFSIIAAMLFLNRNITLGTLIAVFIATSDEAIPILLANPSLYNSMFYIIVIKILLAIVVGYVVDKIIYPKQKLILFADMEEEEDFEDEEEEGGNACPCCYIQYPLPVSALLRSLKIYVFLFVTTFVLTFMIESIGEETLSALLLQNSIFQPIIASLFGFIPNCAASVVLTQLYVAKQVSFASLISGLVTNAGMGLVVLIRYQAQKRDLVRVFTILLVSAISIGIVLQIVL